MKQPYEFPPGDDLPLTWDWQDWLRAGEEIQSATITAGPNLTLTGTTPTVNTVTGQFILAAATAIGTETWARCKVTTNATPPRKATRLLRIEAKWVTVEGDVE